MADEPFANPIAPLSDPSPQSAPAARHPLTNEDFRKLIATPRVGSSTAASVSRLRTASSRSKRPHHSRSQKQVLSHDSGIRKNKGGDERRDDEMDDGKERKAGKQKEPDVLTELSQRYRDRAKERRDGANPDYVSNEELMMTGNGAHVAPDQQSRSDLAERRKQLIEESKFLGGDMEHTHLVKGLDYALLHKVKAELQQMDEEEDEEEDDFVADGKKEIDPSKNRPHAHKSDGTGGGDEFDVKSRLALSIVSLLNQKLQDRSELFVPSRMAYVVDLESEAPDDIPVTVIRSKSECPALGTIFSHSTSDIVINKLASIIYTHRTEKLKDTTALKKERKEADQRKSDNSKTTWSTSEAETTKSRSGISIYDDLVDDYVPPRTKKKSTARN